MKRRSFLMPMLAAAVLDPEKLLWGPGKKLISILSELAMSNATILSPVAYVHMVINGARVTVPYYAL